MTFVLIIAWPLLALPADPFSRSYFGWWVAIAFIWGHVAFIITVTLSVTKRVVRSDTCESYIVIHTLSWVTVSDGGWPSLSFECILPSPSR